MRGTPFFRYTGALLIGIAVAEAWPGQRIIPILIGGGCVATVAWLSYRNQRRRVRPASLLLGLALLGLVGLMGWLAVWVNLPGRLPDHVLRVGELPRAYEAVVTRLPEERAKTYKVELALRRGQLNEGAAPWQPLSGRVLAYLDKGDSLHPTPAPHYGEVWLVLGKPRPVDPPLNPGEFDYQRFLRHRGIYHQQYLRAWQRQVLATDPPSRLLALAYQTSEWAGRTLAARIGSRAEYGLVNAMVLGVRDDLDPAQYQTYAAAGAVHILSVSGLHVGILFLVLNALLKWLAPNREKTAWVIGIKLLVLWFFILMTGFSAPVLRSALMVSFLLLADLINRPHRLLNTLAASALLLLCFDPFALFSAGFQLSYLAVLGIGVCVPYLKQYAKPTTKVGIWLWDGAVVALAAQLTTFPLGLYYFHAFPAYFLLANPVVLLLSAVLVPLSIATLVFGWVPYLGDGLGWLLQKTAWLMNLSVEGIGRLPGAVLEGIWLSPTALWLVYALIAVGCLLWLTRHRPYLNGLAAGALTLTGLLFYEQHQQASQHRLTVHFLPHKTAVSLVSGHHALLLTDEDSVVGTRNYEMYLKNALGQWGVDSLTVGNLHALPPRLPLACQQYPDMTLAVWRGRTLLFVNRMAAYRTWRLPQVVDYAIIRRTAVRDWPTLTRRVVARHVIFDDSNQAEPTSRLLAQTPPPGMQVHAIRRDGVFTATW